MIRNRDNAISDAIKALQQQRLTAVFEMSRRDVEDFGRVTLRVLVSLSSDSPKTWPPGGERRRAQRHAHALRVGMELRASPVVPPCLEILLTGEEA